MKRVSTLVTILSLLLLAATSMAAQRPRAWAPLATATPTVVEDDPDMPSGLGLAMDKADYLAARERYSELRFSEASFDQIFRGRLEGIAQLQHQNALQGPFVSYSFWTPLGPSPIPNGQTTSISTAVSGRVTAIAVHPTNSNIVYVGAAQGGV